MFRQLLLEDLIYSDRLPEKSYHSSSDAVQNTKWAQRKQLLAEILFLTEYYNPKLSQTVIYLGQPSAGALTALTDLFTDLTIKVFNLTGANATVGTAISDPLVSGLDKRIQIYPRHPTELEINEWRGQVYLIADLKSAQATDYATSGTATSANVRRRRLEDLALQQRYYQAYEPIKALLSFTPPYPKEDGKRELFTYLDGRGYFGPWAGNNSTEIKLVPFGFIDSIAVDRSTNGLESRELSDRSVRTTKWDLLRHERIMFFHNDVNRRTKTYGNVVSKSTALDPPELLQDWDSSAEIVILTAYGQRLGLHTEAQLTEFVRAASRRITTRLADRTISARRKHVIKPPPLYIEVKEVMKYMKIDKRTGMRELAPLTAPKETKKFRHLLGK